MEFQINCSPDEIKKFQDIISNNQNRDFVMKRIERNVSGQFQKPSQEEIWQTMVMCLLTSQQRSSSQSSVNKFLDEKPFRLSLDKLDKVDNIESFVLSEIKEFRGIRFGPKIAEQVKDNLKELKMGGWEKINDYVLKLLEQRKQTPRPEHYQLEREAARLISNVYLGFGPKQSRNFWQELGLTRYEFVLDSRVNKWLRQIGFPIPLSSMSMGEEEFYCFLSDILRDLCIKADVLPCVLDAAIFSSYDSQDLPEDGAV